MKLAAADIVHQEFKHSFRGFDPGEVRAFLEVVADHYEAMEREGRLLRDQLGAIQTELSGLRGRVAEQDRMLEQYQSNLRKVEELREAQLDADLILHQARVEAERLITATVERSQFMEAELRMLEAQKARVAAHMKEYLLSQLALLDIVTAPYTPEEHAKRAAATAESDETVKATVRPSADVQTQELAEADIQQYLHDVRLDEVTSDSTEEIRLPKPPPEKQSENKTDADPDRHRKMIDDLNLLSQHATAMFRKSDFQKMLGEDAERKSEEIIHSIYAELEKKKKDRDGSKHSEEA